DEDSINLGSSTTNWKNIYLKGSVYQGSLRIISITGPNTWIGLESGTSNTTGSHNSSSGASSLTLNTSGSFNVAHGEFALGSNSSGSFNSATGCYAMISNLGGHSN